jgi:hypothetical protein
MPRGNRTGPTGMGPMTGRAAGYCGGSGMPGFSNPAFGRGAGVGFARGRGFGGGGRGFRNMFCATDFPGRIRFGGYAQDPAMEKQMLKNQADVLQTELAFINKRLEEFEAGDKDE